jgi:uncharacterized repeat protein (TIGR01451 family)
MKRAILLLIILFSAEGMFAQTCVVPDMNHIVAWWSFDDSTGTTATDITGNHNGTINGATFAPGLVGNAIQFDGIDDFITVPDHDDWAFGYDDFTIEFWMYLDTLFDVPWVGPYSPAYPIINQSEGTWWLTKHWNLLFEYYAGGPGFVSQDPSVNNFVYAGGGDYMDDTTIAWQHFAIVRNVDTMKIYYNSTLIQNQPLNYLLSHIPNIDTTLLIGADFTTDIGGPGFIPYFKGKIDELTIYNRALSNEEVHDIYEAGAAGKCKQFTITSTVLDDAQFGTSFSQSLHAIFGSQPYNWQLTGGTLPEGVLLDSAGILSGVPTQAGEFTFTVMATDSESDTAYKQLTLNIFIGVPPPEIRIYKMGTTAVPGREMDYYILVENVGSVTDTITVTEYLEPWFTFISSVPIAEIVSMDSDYFTNDNYDSIPSVIQWELILNSGETSIITYKVKLQSITPTGKTVAGTACWDLKGASQAQLEMCEEIREQVRIQGQLQCSQQYPSSTWPYNNNLEEFHDCMRKVIDASWETFVSCQTAFARKHDCAESRDSTQAPVDPNEKLILAERVINPDQLLPYVIHFENVGTIEAMDVFITDTLDEDLDEATLNIITPGGTFNPTTRVLKWDLININLQPDSSGYVMYTVKPKPNLPSCSVINNRAYIQFEVFDVFATNETENYIDFNAPEATMNNLPATMYQTAFPISWGGADGCGEIKSYSIFVAVDGGSFELFLSKTQNTSAIYTGETGRSYSFICVAEDLAGNVEVQATNAETSTYIDVLCTTTYYFDADNDGYGDSSYPSMSCSQPAGFVTNSTDCNDDKSEINPGAIEICDDFVDDNCNGNLTDGCCVMTVNAGPDESTYFGYSADQQITRTATVTGGTAPFTYSWTAGRELSCNSVTSSGDEIFSGGTCVHTVCPTSGTLTGIASCSGSASVTVRLIDTTDVCVTVTDANNCTATDCFTVNAIDARCFAGNSQISKVYVCHYTGNNNNPWVQICIDDDAVSAHLGNNSADYLGSCNARYAKPDEESPVRFDVFPNPATDKVTIGLPESMGPVTILVYNYAGQIVKSFNHQATGAFDLDVSDLQPGIYNMEVNGVNMSERVKLVLTE